MQVKDLLAKFSTHRQIDGIETFITEKSTNRVYICAVDYDSTMPRGYGSDLLEPALNRYRVYYIREHILVQLKTIPDVAYDNILKRRRNIFRENPTIWNFAKLAVFIYYNKPSAFDMEWFDKTMKQVHPDPNNEGFDEEISSYLLHLIKHSPLKKRGK